MVLHRNDGACRGGAANVHVEQVHEDRNAIRPGADDRTVYGTDEHALVLRDVALGVAKEPQREEQENERGNGCGPMNPGIERDGRHERGRGERPGVGRDLHPVASIASMRSLSANFIFFNRTSSSFSSSDR